MGNRSGCSPPPATGLEKGSRPVSNIVTDKKARPVSALLAVIVAVCSVGYMIPWMIAALRGKSNHWGIFWLNLLLGWTLIGLVAALVMAVLPHRVVGVRE